MRVDIDPQWWKLARWYWDNASANGVGMSIWEMLERDYGATKVYHGSDIAAQGLLMSTVVDFPDQKSYTAFLLRWA